MRIKKTVSLNGETYREGTEPVLHPELQNKLKQLGAFGTVQKKRKPKRKTKEQKFDETGDKL
jgi:hypothetical protein